jgi:type II secretory pathway component PulK
MKITLAKKRTRRGSAVIIVLVFLALMAVIVVSNNVTLRHLSRNLRLIEQKELRKFASRPSPVIRR